MLVCFSANTIYPVGHPKQRKWNEEEGQVHWTRPADNPYKLAILKVLVVPPRRNILPVLPMRHKGHMILPLCHRCVHQHSKSGWRLQYKCRHTDQQRSWVGTYVSTELDAALAAGYEVRRVFEVLEWEQGDADLFRNYMNEFMELKVHASDFPPEIKGDWEKEEEFLRVCREVYKINVVRSKMKLNKGMRQLAKLFLNNLCELWGCGKWVIGIHYVAHL